MACDDGGGLSLWAAVGAFGVRTAGRRAWEMLSHQVSHSVLRRRTLDVTGPVNGLLALKQKARFLLLRLPEPGFVFSCGSAPMLGFDFIVLLSLLSRVMVTS